MKSLFYISILLIFNASTCSLKKHLKEIKFGQGGGFTGAVIEYQIKNNGDIFITNSLTKENKKVKAISGSDLKKVESEFNKLSEKSLHFNHPFNLYYYIETYNSKIVWGDPEYPEPNEVKVFYNKLLQLIKN